MSILNLANTIAATAADTNVASTGGGGDYTPPAAGLVRLRFVAYVEVGKHFKRGNPALGIPDKQQDTAKLVFECSGPKHPVKVLEDGTKIAQRITVTLAISRSDKSHYFKLFKRLNYEGKATHFSQLLGQAFIGNIRHDTWTGKDGKERVSALLTDSDRQLTIRAPRIERYDDETGETTLQHVKVDEPTSPLRLFVWNADEAIIGQLWDSIYIPKTGSGDYDPNVFQNEIKKATNFEGSAIHGYLKNDGQVAELPPALTADDLGLGKADDSFNDDDIPF